MDRDFVLRWAHLGLGPILVTADIIEEQRRIAEEHTREIWAEQEALDAARNWPGGPPLPIADRYAAGRPRAQSARRVVQRARELLHRVGRLVRAGMRRSRRVAQERYANSLSERALCEHVP